jgi:hypothetical protein
MIWSVVNAGVVVRSALERPVELAFIHDLLSARHALGPVSAATLFAVGQGHPLRAPRIPPVFGSPHVLGRFFAIKGRAGWTQYGSFTHIKEEQPGSAWIRAIGMLFKGNSRTDSLIIIRL